MASNPAQIAKDKGNTAFKAGDYPAAIGHYSEAILADRKDFTFPLNRAAAYLKLGKNDDAERDCTTVLSLSQKNVKAFFRRGQARAANGKHVDAQKDFEAALKLDPSNAAVSEELNKSKIALKQVVPQPRKSPITVDTPPLRTTSAIPKRRRVPITIVESPKSSSSTTSHTKQAPSASDAADLLTPVSSRPLSIPPTTMTPLTPSTSKAPQPEVTPAKPAASFKEVKQARDTAKPTRTGGGIFRASGQHTIFAERQTSTTSQPAAVSAPSKSDDTSSLLLAHTMSTETKPPMTSLMFIKSWDSLKDPLKRWKLLTQIPPSSIPALFQSSLEAHTLASILRTLAIVLDELKNTSDKADQVREWVYAYMENLPRVPRFSTLALFMSSDEKATTRTICSTLEAEGLPVSGWEKV